MISAKKLEQLTSKKRFSSGALLESHLKASTADRRLEALRIWLIKEYYFKALIKGILRFSFLIENVGKERGGATKIRVRWLLERQDPRYCSYADCAKIYNQLISSLKKDKRTLNTLCLFIDFSLISYELPIDYAKRKLPIHRAINVRWNFNSKCGSLIRLRAFLFDNSKSGHSTLFKRLLKDKIKTKVYLTDRVQTGGYKTNREKRWEVHPDSVHFANRTTCFEIEETLIAQLCQFDKFPASLKLVLETNKLIKKRKRLARCPVTFDKLDFGAFKKSVLNPQHGRSDFQVGHLNPLKSGRNNPKFGHTAINTAWITSHGNRLQGHLTIVEWNKLLERILRNKLQMKK